jgi:hypothetical protein
MGKLSLGLSGGFLGLSGEGLGLETILGLRTSL